MARMAVISSRFAPIIRTFVPFVAGAAAMSASKFLLYNVVGGLLWTALCVGAGYAFGNVPVIKNNFSLVALGIVAVSLLPMVSRSSDSGEPDHGWIASPSSVLHRKRCVQDVDDDVQVRVGEQQRDAAGAVLELRRQRRENG